MEWFYALFLSTGPIPGGWTTYPPIREIPEPSSGSGTRITLWLVSLMFLAVSLLLSGVNYIMKTSVDSIYFEQLNKMLKNHNRAIPFLLVDLDILDQNIATLQQSVLKHIDYRIVVKSLPSKALLDYIIQKTGAKRLMVFHQPFLSQIAQGYDASVDVLLGKPMPIKTAKYFYNSYSESKNGFNPYTQIQWLIDTTERLSQYLNLAKLLGEKLRINLEIDVGLHRGGFADTKQLNRGLELLDANKEFLEFSGLMGYDPHIVKLPKLLRSQKKSFQMMNDFYQECKGLIKNSFPALWNDKLTFNGAGSPTVNFHSGEDSPLNDISAGSCLVKPTTFDIDSLTAYKPCSFIATPILKKFEGTQIPGLEKLKPLLSMGNKVNAKSYFIYGGYWKADYHYPAGLRQNPIYGASTNQTMVNAPASANIEVDDFVFLRPHQSEFVFLQFGKILAVRNFKIEEEWDILTN